MFAAVEAINMAPAIARPANLFKARGISSSGVKKNLKIIYVTFFDKVSLKSGILWKNVSGII